MSRYQERFCRKIGRFPPNRHALAEEADERKGEEGADSDQIDGLCAEVFGPGGDVFVIVLEVPAPGAAGLRGLADLKVGYYRMK